MNRLQQIEQFGKLAAYILGRHPDEFGLVLDDSGYIKIKDFLKTVNEIDGWKYIRLHHINEMMLVSKNSSIETDQNLIRAKHRELIPKPLYCEAPPKFLYICISQKSYPAVAEYGIHPTFHSHVICSTAQELAEKIGKRRDNQTVLLIIHSAKTKEKGISFHQYGDLIYLADFIPPECFTGPPLPKEPFKDNTVDPLETYRRQTQAGSFAWSPNQSGPKIKDKKKEINWKKDKKKLRKEKKRFWPG